MLQWARLCKAFLVEAQWFRHGQLPNTEDYLKNGIISSGVPAVLTHAFFILGQGMTKETIDLFNNNNLPSIVSSTATILRLWDDFGSAQVMWSCLILTHYSISWINFSLFVACIYV